MLFWIKETVALIGLYVLLLSIRGKQKYEYYVTHDMERYNELRDIYIDIKLNMKYIKERRKK